MKNIILILPHISGRGGTETVIKTAIDLLKNNKDFRFKLFILGGSDDKAWLKGIQYDESMLINNKYMRIVPNFYFLFKYLLISRPYMVICLTPVLCLLTNLVRFVSHKKYPIISWIHFSLNRNNIKVNLLHKANFHLAISSGIKRQLEKVGIQKEKVYLVYNPVKRTDQIIERPSIGCLFTYIGRIQFESQKRLKDLLIALSQLSGEWQLNVYGAGNDIEECKNYAQKLSIEKNIVWYGWVSNPWGEIGSTSALVLTSLFEGLPMVLAEAISRGIYCISSNCETGPEDIIMSNINGELYPAGDIVRLKNELQEIVDGKRLPDQNKMKSSINHLYLDTYSQRLLSTIKNIECSWYNRSDNHQS